MRLGVLTLREFYASPLGRATRTMVARKVTEAWGDSAGLDVLALGYATPFLDGAKVLQPSLFIAGDRDPVIAFHREEFLALESNVPNLRKKVLIEGAGHWIQQERPEDVTRLLTEFLLSL